MRRALTTSTAFWTSDARKSAVTDAVAADCQILFNGTSVEIATWAELITMANFAVSRTANIQGCVETHGTGGKAKCKPQSFQPPTHPEGLSKPSLFSPFPSHPPLHFDTIPLTVPRSRRKRSQLRNHQGRPYTNLQDTRKSHHNTRWSKRRPSPLPVTVARQLRQSMQNQGILQHAGVRERVAFVLAGSRRAGRWVHVIVSPG